MDYRQQLNEMAMGFMRGKVLCAAVRLRVPDALAEAPKALAELAAATGSDAEGLRRLLRSLASMGLVSEVSPGLFTLTEMGQPLRRDAPDSVWASAIFWSDLLADSWTYLHECVRAGGRAGAEEARAKDGSISRWSLERDANSIFHAVFAQPSAEDYAPVAAAYDFSRYQVVADLGGGGGGLLAAILNAHPHLRGMLVDRPEALPAAGERFASAGLSGRTQCLAADLLEAVPAGADLYTMRCVLHGCLFEPARKILTHCAAVMSPEHRLLIIEVVLPDRVERSDPELEKLMMADLNMLAVTGGLERSESQWRDLISSAGLELLRLIPVGGSSILEVRNALPQSGYVRDDIPER